MADALRSHQVPPGPWVRAMGRGAGGSDLHFPLCAAALASSVLHTGCENVHVSPKLNDVPYGTTCMKQFCVHSVSHNLENTYIV